MFRGLNRLLAVAAVAFAVFIVPQAALAGGCNGGPSAVEVYKECLPNGGGGNSSGAKSGGQTSGGQGSQGSSSTPIVIPHQTSTALKKAGKDGQALKKLVHAYGLRRTLQASHASAATDPTAIGSAFDLGSGPTILLVVLAGTAVLLLAAGGYRGLRHRHR